MNVNIVACKDNMSISMAMHLLVHKKQQIEMSACKRLTQLAQALGVYGQCTLGI